MCKAKHFFAASCSNRWVCNTPSTFVWKALWIFNLKVHKKPPKPPAFLCNSVALQLALWHWGGKEISLFLLKGSSTASCQQMGGQMVGCGGCTAPAPWAEPANAPCRPATWTLGPQNPPEWQAHFTPAHEKGEYLKVLFFFPHRSQNFFH